MTSLFTTPGWLCFALFALAVATPPIGTYDARFVRIAGAASAAEHEDPDRAVIEPESAREAFISFLTARDLDLNDLSLRDGMTAMLDFYRDVRASGLNLENQDDMLLFQWGTFDWGQGEHFEVDITRQLVFQDRKDEDARIWQLSLRFRFEPSPELLSLGDQNKWCDLPGDLPKFTAFVLASPAMTTAAHGQAVQVSLVYERAD